MSQQEQLSLAPDAAVAAIADRCRATARTHGGRVAVGLAGGPGVGKSTLAVKVVARLNAATPGIAAYVPMDGFHMRHSKLEAMVPG